MTTILPHGTPIPGALGGVRSDGAGGVLIGPEATIDAWNRMWSIVRASSPGEIPAPTPTGNLPPGVYDAEWTELVQRLSGGPRRADLTGQLGRTFGILHKAGVTDALVAGSYVGTKFWPGDVDIAVLPTARGRTFDVPALQRKVANVAPDVHVYPGWSVVPNAQTLGHRAGENFVEFFLHDRANVARGALLLKPQSPKAIASATAQLARTAA